MQVRSQSQSISLHQLLLLQQQQQASNVNQRQQAGATPNLFAAPKLDQVNIGQNMSISALAQQANSDFIAQKDQPKNNRTEPVWTLQLAADGNSNPFKSGQITPPSASSKPSDSQKNPFQQQRDFQQETADALARSEQYQQEQAAKSARSELHQVQQQVETNMNQLYRLQQTQIADQRKESQEALQFKSNANNASSEASANNPTKSNSGSSEGLIDNLMKTIVGLMQKSNELSAQGKNSAQQAEAAGMQSITPDIPIAGMPSTSQRFRTGRNPLGSL